jgi:hypothetical protein
VQGLMNSAGVTKFLLGVLTEIEDGALFLEDTTGARCDPPAQRRFLPLDLPLRRLRGEIPLQWSLPAQGGAWSC